MPKNEITNGANKRASDELTASTAPGIPSHALLLSEELPKEPSNEKFAQTLVKLGAPDLTQ